MTSRDLYGLTKRSFAELLRIFRRAKRLDAELQQIRDRLRASRGAKRAHPVALAKTRDGGDYPADLETPGYLVYDVEFVGRTFAETAGAATPTDAVWTGRFRKAMTLRKTKGFPVGTLCVVFRLGRRLYLEPIDGPCDLIPATWSSIEGYDDEADQMLVKAAGECPKWVTVGECP